MKVTVEVSGAFEDDYVKAVRREIFSQIARQALLAKVLNSETMEFVTKRWRNKKVVPKNVDLVLVYHDLPKSTTDIHALIILKRVIVDMGRRCELRRMG